MRKIAASSIMLLLFTFAPQLAGAKTVNEATAKTAGANWLSVKGVKNPILNTAYTASQKSGAKTVTDFYVFSLSGAKGWVIVSADDRITPILAYSTNSDFEIAHPAPSTKSWLTGYQNQITHAISANTTPAGVAEMWAALKTGINTTAERTTAVSPLVATTWDQEPLYNAFCPYDHTYSALTATGCVATAMAQVMKYWNWPVRGCGNHSYEDDPYGILSADFGATAYQWTAMPNMLFSANNAVAQLMYHAGVSVDMAYGTDATDGSGAFINTIESSITPCAEFALKANFHYKRSLRSIIRFGEGAGSGYDSIAETTWISTLERELDSSRPIIYGGANDTVGGHCWVCDGYDATNLFHFNWGWSGLNDGYYTVDNLDPSSLGVGGAGGNFNFDQTAIIGIQPDSFPSTPGTLQLLTYLNTSNTPAEYGGAFSISTKVINTGSATYSGDFCAQLYDSTNALAGIVATIPGNIINTGDSSALLTFSTTGMYNLVAGLYGVRICYRPAGSATWTPVANNGNFYNFTYITIANDTDMEISATTTVSPAILTTHGPVSVTASVYNDGSANFYGGLRATLNSIVDGSELFTIQTLTSQYIDTYATSVVTFTCSSLPLTPGTYVLEIQHQYGGTGGFYLTGSTYAINPILVNVAWAASVPQVTAATGIFVYPNPATDELTINLNGQQASTIRITDIQGKVLQEFTPDNQPLVSVSLNGYSAGMYLAHIVTAEGVTVQKFVITR